MYWNPAAEKTFGYTEKEAVGKKLAELVIPSHGYKNHTCIIDKRIKEQFNFKKTFDFIALRKDKTELPIDLSVSSVKLKTITVC